MGVRIYLLLFGLLTAPFGIYCFVQPEFLAGFAGVAATSTTGTVELRAMYGGLQTALGLLAFVGAFRASYARAALLTAAFLCAGLGSFRLLGALMAGEVSYYSAQGMTFEFLAAIIAIVLLRRNAHLR